jgi:glycine/sarcosine N-methyltransferase
MNRMLRPQGTAIVTTRDYDRILADPPASTLPQVFQSDGTRVISFQLRDWHDKTGTYDLEHFQVHENPDGTPAAELRTATYRACTRAALTGFATAAGLESVSWHMPRESGFFQPVDSRHPLTS